MVVGRIGLCLPSAGFFSALKAWGLPVYILGRLVSALVVWLYLSFDQKKKKNLNEFVVEAMDKLAYLLASKNHTQMDTASCRKGQSPSSSPRPKKKKGLDWIFNLNCQVELNHIHPYLLNKSIFFFVNKLSLINNKGNDMFITLKLVQQYLIKQKLSLKL